MKVLESVLQMREEYAFTNLGTLVRIQETAVLLLIKFGESVNVHKAYAYRIAHGKYIQMLIITIFCINKHLICL